MQIKIIKGNLCHITDCEDALINSELGRKYFSLEGSAKRALENGFKNDEIYVAIDADNNCVGFVWFILNGAFHAFPYLHIISVKENYRNLGIGKKLLEFYEDISFKNRNKVFLVVADFNEDAKRLYERLGYKEVGIIPSLYREGITEHLMMKLRNN